MLCIRVELIALLGLMTALLWLRQRRWERYMEQRARLQEIAFRGPQ